MKPDIWGPALWNVLFDVAHYYRGTMDRAIRDKLQLFFEYLQYILPCVDCRKHSRIFYDMHKTLPTCQEDYGMYMLYPLRNAINRRLGKRDLPVRTYLERRAVIPLSGSNLTLYFICKILWTTEIDKDYTLDKERAADWCRVAYELVSPIPNYGPNIWVFEDGNTSEPILRTIPSTTGGCEGLTDEVTEQLGARLEHPTAFTP